MLRLDQASLGQRSAPQTHRLERGAIAKFARAIGYQNPIHFSPDAARQAGFRDVVAPPTFVVTLLAWSVPGVTLPAAGVLHGEQAFDWETTLCAGDTVTVCGWVEDVKSRSGQKGQMTIITVANQGELQGGPVAFRSRSVLVVTEEVSHADRG
jgi:acyl dehydratase